MKKIAVVLIVLFIFIGVCGFTLYYYGYSMATLPTGEYIGESTSPNGLYTIKAYVCVAALISDRVRCELINNTNGKTKNIYWEYRECYAEIYWESDNIAVINGIKLNVEKDIYDFRRN